MLALLLLAHAQQLLCCDDTVFSATTQVQLLCSGVPLQPVLLCPHCYGHTCQPRQGCQKNSAVALAWCALTPQLRYQHQMRSSHVQFCTRCPPSILRMAKRRGWSLCPLPALDTWQQLLWWLNGLLKGFAVGTFVKQQFPIRTFSVILAPSYSQGTFLLFCFDCGLVFVCLF